MFPGHIEKADLALADGRTTQQPRGMVKYIIDFKEILKIQKNINSFIGAILMSIYSCLTCVLSVLIIHSMIDILG